MGCCLFDCVTGIVLTVLRWAIFLINFVFIVFGAALIVLGSIIKLYTEEWSEFYSENAQIAAIVCIVAGSLTLMVSFLAVWITNCSKEMTPWKMYSLSGVLFVTFAITLAGGICAFEYQKYFSDQVEVNMIEMMKRYPAPGAGGDHFAKETWDSLHHEYECCGIHDIRDWSTYRPQLGGYPLSCLCEEGSYGCGALGQGFYYKTGCYTKLQPYLSNLSEALGAIAITVALLELGASIVAICLANVAKREKKGSIS